MKYMQFFYINVTRFYIIVLTFIQNDSIMILERNGSLYELGGTKWPQQSEILRK